MINLFPESWGRGTPIGSISFIWDFVTYGVYTLYSTSFPMPSGERLSSGGFFCIFSTANSDTVGSHRLWTHRSFKANIILRSLLSLMACGANQGSIYHWARDHRTHHKHSDTNCDPHNSKNGFWYSHIGWLLVKKDFKVRWAGCDIDMKDLREDPVVMSQKSKYSSLAFLFCFLYPTILMCYLFDETLWNSLGISFLRYCTLLNASWCVNSVAHFYGTRPYGRDISPADNTFVSVIAGDEGYHNYHHTYPRDYATSEYGILEQWNPSKLFIDCFAVIGWTWDRKKNVNVSKCYTGDPDGSRVRSFSLFDFNW